MRADRTVSGATAQRDLLPAAGGRQPSAGVSVVVDEVVVHGIDIADPARFATTVSAELAERIAARGLPAEPHAQAERPAVVVTVDSLSDVDGLAGGVVDALWVRLGGER